MSSSRNANLPVKENCDAPGRQAYSIWGNSFVIDEQYVPIKAIGKGAYGTVCSAKNTVTGEKVAIKKIQNAFENLTDARRTLREIKLLRHLKHENVIGVRDLLFPANPQDFKDVYIVYELMDTDLHQIIRSPQPLTDDHFQFFVYQVCLALLHTVLRGGCQTERTPRPCRHRRAHSIKLLCYADHERIEIRAHCQRPAP